MIALPVTHLFCMVGLFWLVCGKICYSTGCMLCVHCWWYWDTASACNLTYINRPNSNGSWVHVFWYVIWGDDLDGLVDDFFNGGVGIPNGNRQIFFGGGIGQRSVGLAYTKNVALQCGQNTRGWVIGLVYSGHCTASNTHCSWVHSLCEGWWCGCSVITLGFLVDMDLQAANQQIRSCQSGHRFRLFFNAPMRSYVIWATIMEQPLKYEMYVLLLYCHL